MIYLDNAATSVMRPQCVVDAVCRALTSLGNPGRGATSESLDAGRVVWECREKVAALLGCPRADHVCFAANATAALNAAIHGLVRPGFPRLVSARQTASTTHCGRMTLVAALSR